MKAADGLIDTNEAAELLGCALVTIQQLARRHKIGQRLQGPSVRGTILFTEQDLDQLRSHSFNTGRPPFETEKGEMTLTQAAAFLGISTGVISSQYVPNGQLVPLRRVGTGRGILLFSEGDVKRFAMQRVKSDDRRVQLRFSPVYVEGHALRNGSTPKRAKQLGAAALERHSRLKRVRTGIAGRPTGTTSSTSARFQARYDSLPDYDYAVAASINPSQRHVQVYLFDWLEHPDDWPRDEYPADPSDPDAPSPGTYRRGANRVSKALKRLKA